jgi:DNA-binding CsgD family transcriptional regulator
MSNGADRLESRCHECLLYGAVAGLDDGVILVGNDGRILLLNRRAEELLALEGGGVAGQPLRTVLRDPKLIHFWSTASHQLEAAVCEWVAAPDRTVRATVAVCRGASGAVIGRMLNLRDVSRERAIHVELSAAVARRLAALAGGDDQPEVLPLLTRREGEILRLLASGLTNAAIAARLRVSINTVASHIKHLYPKLGVVNRSQATAVALSHGIYPDPR